METEENHVFKFKSRKQKTSNNIKQINCGCIIYFE